MSNPELELEDNIDLKKYLPTCYEGVVEVETEQDALSIEINKYDETVEQAMNDQFIQNCSLKAIGYHEQTFHIYADPTTESLEFRKQRLLSRMKNLRPPYTYWYLRGVLDGFFGKNNYTLEIDNDNYRIILESSASDSLWYHEIQVIITKVKPCNMIFINRPQITETLLINEEINSTSSTRNYILDGTWELGRLPFVSPGQERIEKMPYVSSIKQALISLNLEYLKTVFNNVVLNNSIVVTELNLSVNTDRLIIEYGVSHETTTSITDIKLRDSEDITLINSQVFIPIEDYVIIKHIIKLEEGVND